jgi:hypothetical protein
MKFKITLHKEFEFDTSSLDDETLRDAAESLGFGDEDEQGEFEVTSPDSLTASELRDIVDHLLETDLEMIFDPSDIDEMDFKVAIVEGK